MTIPFCGLRGSSDDIVTHRLLTRLSDQSTLARQGKVERGLSALLNTDIDSDEFLRGLQSACDGTEYSDTEPVAELDSGVDWE